MQNARLMRMECHVRLGCGGVRQPPLRCVSRLRSRGRAWQRRLVGAAVPSNALCGQRPAVTAFLSAAFGSSRQVQAGGCHSPHRCGGWLLGTSAAHSTWRPLSTAGSASCTATRGGRVGGSSTAKGWRRYMLPRRRMLYPRPCMYRYHVPVPCTRLAGTCKPQLGCTSRRMTLRTIHSEKQPALRCACEMALTCCGGGALGRIGGRRRRAGGGRRLPFAWGCGGGRLTSAGGGTRLQGLTAGQDSGRHSISCVCAAVCW